MVTFLKMLLMMRVARPWWCRLHKTRHITTLSTRLQTLQKAVEEETPQRQELEQQSDMLWKQPTLAKQYAALTKRHNDYSRIQSDAQELLDMQHALDDASNEESDWIQEQLHALEGELKHIVRTVLFDEPNDVRDCWLELSAGSGGDDAMDFTAMLSNMYLKWGERHGFTINIVDVSHGEIAGYRNARLSVIGDHAYGWLTAETGVHRLVRNSPFNKANTRETSFSKVEVVPKVDMQEMPPLCTADLQIQTYKSGGKGGQHANTTDSAVRIVHTSSGIVATSSKERSQHANKKHCMEILLGKLARLHEGEQATLREQKHLGADDISWSSQVRTYQLSTGLFKDHRSGYETNPSKVLEGEGLQEVLVCGLHARKGIAIDR